MKDIAYRNDTDHSLTRNMPCLVYRSPALLLWVGQRQRGDLLRGKHTVYKKYAVDALSLVKKSVAQAYHRVENPPFSFFLVILVVYLQTMGFFIRSSCFVFSKKVSGRGFKLPD